MQAQRKAELHKADFLPLSTGLPAASHTKDCQQMAHPRFEAADELRARPGKGMRDCNKGPPIAAFMQVFWQQIHQIPLQNKPEPATSSICTTVLAQLEALRRYLGTKSMSKLAPDPRLGRTSCGDQQLAMGVDPRNLDVTCKRDGKKI